MPDSPTTTVSLDTDAQPTYDAPSVTVNGVERPLSDAGPHTTVLDWLRGQGLTGAKEGCAEGECGACSVLVARPTPETGEGVEWTALNACLVPAAAFDGQELVTSEGLGSTGPGQPTALHPVQQEMAERGGSQCGYCTPGFVCSMAAEFYRAGRTADGPANGAVTPDQLHDQQGERAGTEVADDRHEHGPNGFDLHALSGNLCRCTGYRPIRDAAYALGTPTEDDALARRRSTPAPAPRRTRLEGSTGARFVRPADLAETLALIAEHPDAQLVAGSTDWGVEVNLKGARTGLTVAVDRLAELRRFEVGDDAVRIGAALTLTEVERLLAGRVPLLAQVFPQFASRLIRNGATLGGNLGTASPIGDTPPALLALDATLALVSADGEREVRLAEYYTGYRQSVRRPDELIAAVLLPMPQARLTGFHKIAKRRFDDISSVAVGFAVDVEDGVVTQARIGLGGVAATPLRATATEQQLVGGGWDADAVRRAATVLGAEGTPLDDHRASARYRSAMLRRSLEKFFDQHPDGASRPAQEVRA